MELDDNLVIKDEWQGGHHRRFWVNKDTGKIVADAYEIYHTTHAESVVRKKCREKLIADLSFLFGKMLENKNNGLKARFSKNTANKIASDKAITKSVVNGFSVKEHFEAATNIKDIFETADFIGTFPDSSNDPNILAIHRFQKEITLESRKKCVAYLTLKEVKKNGSRIYTQELLLKKYPLL